MRKNQRLRERCELGARELRRMGERRIEWNNGMNGIRRSGRKKKGEKE